MEQQSLFPIIDQQFFQPNPPPTNQHAVEVIRGLRYVSNYITEFQHDWLLNEIEKHEWGNFYQRRIQHYGESYTETMMKPTMKDQLLRCLNGSKDFV